MEGRYRICQGGMRAGKTYAILQYLIAYAETVPGKVISVISSTLPALRLGAIRDFNNILDETGHNIYFNYNLSSLTWTCRATGTKIEFFGLDGKDGEMKARGASRDVMFINEANRMRWETFKQLAMRTSEFIYLDYNPSARFWAHDNLQNRPDASFEIYTYLDNQEIPPEIKRSIESHDKTGNWWRVYGEGQIGELEGNVFKGWTFFEEWTEPKDTVVYGIDFGFNPDPCAMVAISKVDGGMLIEELFQRNGLTSLDIVRQVQRLIDPNLPVICDNARPEIIADMKQAGIHALPCVKSERFGEEIVGRMHQIEMMAEHTFFAVGKNLEREYLSYSYHQNKDGKLEAIIPKGNDHFMDAARYSWFWWHRRGMIENKVKEDLKGYR